MIVTDQPSSKAAPRSARCKATLAIHGGAGGTLPPHLPSHLEQAYRAALRRSLTKGYRVLSGGGSALEAVCASVQEMEDDPLFNAARGAVFTTAGTNECEASVMNASAPNHKHHDSQASLQRNRRCASAILIRNTRNPILLAKALYENAKENPHVILSARTAEEIGWKLGCERVDSQYYFTRRRWLEHRRDLGLPDDDDPAMAGGQDEEEEEPWRTAVNPFEPPPSYYANSSDTDDTPSLSYASSHGSRSSFEEKETESSASTAQEAVTPSVQSVLGDGDGNGDVGLQHFTHWHTDFDERRPRSDYQGAESGSVLGDEANRRSSSLEESRASLRRHQGPQALDSLPAGTVGAVALDEEGNLAVATSTGGMTNKLPGRIGDTPTPGAGFWSEYWRTDALPVRVMRVKEAVASTSEATRTTRRSCGPPCQWIRWVFGSRTEAEEQQDEEDAIEQASNASIVKEKRAKDMQIRPSTEYRGVALSGTGTGDAFLRSSFASLVVHRMRFLDEGVDVASSKAVAEMGDLGGVGGAVCIDDRGRGACRERGGALERQVLTSHPPSVSFPMNSATMNRGYITQGGPPRVAIFANEECA